MHDQRNGEQIAMKNVWLCIEYSGFAPNELPPHDGIL